MATIASYSHGRDNNFNLLRIVAASLVIYSHSFPMLQGRAANGQPIWAGEWLFDWTGMDLGRVAVQIFFVMSGFLVAQSLQRQPNLFSFFSARALRIVPGLTAAVLFAALLVGAVCTRLPLQDYFGSESVFRHIFANLTLQLDMRSHFLPGVFDANPNPNIVNGSLWTLTWEVFMYLSLGALGFLGLFRRTGAVVGFGLLIVALYLSNRQFQWIGLAYAPMALHFLSAFYLGVLMWVARARIPMGRGTLLGALALLWLSLEFFKVSAVARLVFPLLLAYTVIAVALVPVGFIRRYNRVGDYSYGTYVYAYPLQQALVLFFPLLTPLGLFWSAFALTLVFAIPSWHWLERPALQFKPRARRAVVPALAGAR